VEFEGAILKGYRPKVVGSVGSFPFRQQDDIGLIDGAKVHVETVESV
jgi:hypothetical protein